MASRSVEISFHISRGYADPRVRHQHLRFHFVIMTIGCNYSDCIEGRSSALCIDYFSNLCTSGLCACPLHLAFGQLHPYQFGYVLCIVAGTHHFQVKRDESCASFYA